MQLTSNTLNLSENLIKDILEQYDVDLTGILTKEQIESSNMPSNLKKALITTLASGGILVGSMTTTMAAENLGINEVIKEKEIPIASQIVEIAETIQQEAPKLEIKQETTTETATKVEVQEKQKEVVQQKPVIEKKESVQKEPLAFSIDNTPVEQKKSESGKDLIFNITSDLSEKILDSGLRITRMSDVNQVKTAAVSDDTFEPFITYQTNPSSYVFAPENGTIIKKDGNSLTIKHKIDGFEYHSIIEGITSDLKEGSEIKEGQTLGSSKGELKYATAKSYKDGEYFGFFHPNEVVNTQHSDTYQYDVPTESIKQETPKKNVSSEQEIVNQHREMFKEKIEELKNIKAPNVLAVAPSDLLKDVIVVIDAGHGGNDPGALGWDENKTEEQLLNLQLSFKAEKDLKAQGATVVMTRNSDKTLELWERVGVSKSQLGQGKKVLFISFHNNSSVVKSQLPSGFETYYGKGAESQKLAQDVHKFLAQELSMIPDRKVKNGSGAYHILRENSSEVVSILLETGFMLHPYDLEIIKNDVIQQGISNSVVRGVLDYFGSTPIEQEKPNTDGEKDEKSKSDDKEGSDSEDKQENPKSDDKEETPKPDDKEKEKEKEKEKDSKSDNKDESKTDSEGKTSKSDDKEQNPKSEDEDKSEESNDKEETPKTDDNTESSESDKKEESSKSNDTDKQSESNDKDTSEKEKVEEDEDSPFITDSDKEKDNKKEKEKEKEETKEDNPEDIFILDMFNN